MMAPISASWAMERRWPRWKGGFADHENEAAALFEADVGGACDEIVRDAVGNGGESMNGAGGDDHGRDGKAAGGDGSADVERGIGNRGNILEIGGRFLQFEKSGAFAGSGKHEVGLSGGVILEELEEPPAVNGAGSTRDGDDNFGFFHVRRRIVPNSEQILKKFVFSSPICCYTRVPS
jgi:hypothetical protein